MTKSSDLAKNYSGVFGSQVTLKSRKGKSVITMPSVRPKLVPSEKQIAVRERFKLAANYARNAMKDPQLKAMYSERVHKSLSPFRLAANDFLQIPHIQSIDPSGYRGEAGQKIIVIARDNFKLESVTMKITDSSGKLVEEGDCVLSMPTGNYEYTTGSQVPSLAGVVLLARVKDLPGNVKELSLTL